MVQSTCQQVEKRQIIISTNPAQEGVVLGEVAASTPDEISAAVAAARRAQPDWQALGLDGRISQLEKLAQVFKDHREEFIHRPTQEMGASITVTTSLTKRGEEAFRWNLDNAHKALDPKVVYEDGHELNELWHEPYGVMACIVAWNFPYLNFVQSVVPPLLVGNTVVMKYSEEIPLFGQFMEELMAKAGLPEGVVRFIHGDGSVGAALVEEDIDMISFTGSYQTGQKLYETAARKFIPIVNELGGSSPGLVFEDANLDQIIEALFWDRFANTGQFCSNLKRLIVHEGLFDECVQKLVAYAQTKVVGDPQHKETDLGPLVAQRQVLALEAQLEDALAKGAKIVCGGGRPEGLKGAYFEPTILTDVSTDMRVWREEVFGPLLPIVAFRTYEEGIALANDTDYGLTASVYTQDQALYHRVAQALKCGCVKGQNATFGHNSSPFGGYKKSGMGRVRGLLGFHDAAQTKTVARVKSLNAKGI